MNKYHIKTTGSILEIEFSSQLELVSRAVEDMLLFLEIFYLEFPIFHLNLITREALNNAVLHGNKSDVSLRVKLIVTVLDDVFTLIIEDEGKGFDWKSEIKKEFKGFQESGMGIEIMTRNGYDVLFNDRGNKITLSRSTKVDK